ncbi:aminoglycoside phosphotransferase family protein [Nocardioides daejeonensis]|uniref:aminoglycoside phosphotransferase family protein n=1 Tax=Nocardioides daejeonensis TaxID=1046556 RepID=UPI001EF53B6E|nr:aminoglycoside phosphotransferase family protein [Nocardioides daejeonensis]
MTSETRIEVPPGLETQRHLGTEWADWLDQLPALTSEVLADWQLDLEGPLWHGFCSLTAPVRTADGSTAVLKIGLPDAESEHEHLALQRWQGRGAARLKRADPSRRSLLLERLERIDLTDQWDEEACAIVAGLYRQLHLPALPQLRDQAAYVRGWADDLRLDLATVPIPRRMAEQALALAAELTAEPGTALLHGDLHYANVLRGERDGHAQWLAIDPKPTAGDPHYELEPMLRDRFEEYGVVGTVRDGIRRRFHTLVDVAEFDEDRARGWVVVRSVLNAHWAYQDAVRAQRAPTAEEREHITRCITVAKAVQD